MSTKALSGAELITLERHRQIDVEGYTAEHDHDLPPHQMVDAALAYAVQGQDRLSAAAGYGPVRGVWWCYFSRRRPLRTRQ